MQGSCHVHCLFFTNWFCLYRRFPISQSKLNEGYLRTPGFREEGYLRTLEFHLLATVPVGALWIGSSEERESILVTVCLFGAVGEMSAAQALREACHNIKEVCAHMKTTFLKAVDDYKHADLVPMEQ